MGDEHESVPLPQGWKSFMSPQGRRYYVNTSSNETTWECPAGAPGPQKTPLKLKSSTGTSLFQQDKCPLALRKTSSEREVGQIKSQFVFCFQIKMGHFYTLEAQN
ncbi:growth arrest-specific protein 7-like [Conger conger]|uniref:growth arrest-specific protein 7-like n=1 Tax=Conger conger TaxID=82655 RepID=UPI002A5A730C|nr:growth arrest-specific protein 7-like [Conger conger]